MSPASSSSSPLKERKRETSRRSSKASYWKDPEKSRKDVSLRVKRYREKKKGAASASEAAPVTGSLVNSPGYSASIVLPEMISDAPDEQPVRRPCDFHPDGRPMTDVEIGERDWDDLWALCDRLRDEQYDEFDCEEVEEFLLTGVCQCLGASRECGHAPLVL